MPATAFTFVATPRNQFGTAHTRRLRRNHQVPAVIYGADKAPESVTLEHKEVMKLLSHDEVFSKIVAVQIGKHTDQAVIKDIERHHTKPMVMHIDFQRIKANEQITMHVPIHFIGEEVSPGVKAGGVVSHLLKEIEIKCLPANLPQSIDVDLSQLEIEHAVHLSDVKLPSGVEFASEITEEHNPTILSIHHPRVEAEESAEAAGNETPAEETKTSETDKTEES